MHLPFYHSLFPHSLDVSGAALDSREEENHRMVSNVLELVIIDHV